MCLENISPLMRQSWVVSGVLLSIMTSGFQLGYTSTLLRAINSTNSTMHLDKDTSSWLASCIGPANLVGFFASSVSMAWLGRRASFLLSSIPGTLTWILIYLAQDIKTLMLGRILGGIATGGTICLGAVVIGEYSSPQHRGMFLNLKTTAICLGATIIHLVDQYFHWRTVCLFGLLVQVISFGITITWPESPHWLAYKRKYVESESAFIWLRGTGSEAKEEFKRLLKSHKTNRQKTESPIPEIRNFFHRFTKMSFIRPTVIVLFGFLLLESSGRHFFPAYAPQIVEELTGNKNQTFVYLLGIDLIITLSSLFSAFLIKVIRRRILLFSTGFASITVLYVSCTCLFLNAYTQFQTSTSVISSLFAIYFILVNLGCTPIPLALLGEIFPLEHRAAGSAVTGVIISLSLWVALKIPPYLLPSTHIYGTFGIFGMCQLIALLTLYFILPETKDKTLEEIERFVKSGCYEDGDSEEEDTFDVKDV